MTAKKRSSGDGTCWKRTRADGREVWDVQYAYVDPVTGRRKRVTKRGFASEKEANAYRRKQVAAVEAGLHVEPSKRTLGQHLELWLAGHQGKQQTIEGYRTKVRLHITPHIGHLPLKDVRGDHLDALYRHLEAAGSPGGKGPLSKTSVREVHNILSGAFTNAIAKGLLITSPTKRATPPRAEQAKAEAPEMVTWTADELKTFLHAERARPLYPVWVLLATTGMRRGEALGLRWADIDLENARLSVRKTVGAIRGKVVTGTPKSGKPRVIDLDPQTVAVLRTHKAQQAAVRLAAGPTWVDQGLAFARTANRLAPGATAGGHLHPDRVLRFFSKAVERVNRDLAPDKQLPKLSLHGLRHTWATLAMQSGVHPKVVQERLGHATIGITLGTYSHVAPTMQAEAARNVAAALFG